MKKITALLVVICVIAACSKKSSAPSFTYVVNGVHDISVSNYDSTSLALSVSLLTGTQEIVAIKISGLPAGVTASPASTSGTPTYSTSINLIAKNATQGTYPVTITTSSSSTAAKTYSFNLTVAAAANCASFISGIYSGSDACAPYPGAAYTTSITPSSTPYQVTITNFSGATGTIYGTLNCDKDSITIPLQPFAGGTIQGTGSFSSDKIIINYTAVEDTFHNYCVSTLIKQ